MQVSTLEIYNTFQILTALFLEGMRHGKSVLQKVLSSTNSLFKVSASPSVPTMSVLFPCHPSPATKGSGARSFVLGST